MNELAGARVRILMGSKNDWPQMKACSDLLNELGVRHAVRIASAHRTPAKVEALVKDAEESGVRVFVAAAGMAAHLAGAVAARTARPVIGVPIAASPLQGLDALLSTVQMPPGLPVLTVSIDVPGAKNAAVAAAQILAVSDPDLHERVTAYRRTMAEEVERQSETLAQEQKPHG